MTGIPVLSVMTWAPFVSALLIMFFAHRRPMLVRFISLAGATVSLVASLWIFWAYDRDLAGFQFQDHPTEVFTDIGPSDVGHNLELVPQLVNHRLLHQFFFKGELDPLLSHSQTPPGFLP